MFWFYVFNFEGGRERNKSSLVTNTSNYAHIFMNNNKLPQPKTFLSTVRKIHQHNLVLQPTDLKYFPGRA